MKKKRSWKETLCSFAVILALLAIFGYLGLVFSRRVYVWILLILLGGLTVLNFIPHLQKSRHPKLKEYLIDAEIVIVIVLVYLARHYAISNGNAWKLIVIPAILGILVGVIYVFAKDWKKDERAAIIFSLLFVCVSLVFIFCTTAHHLNYLLSFDAPEEYEAVIEDKDHDNYRKSIDRYSFFVTVNGERFEIEVSSSQYHYYEVGDRYRFQYYKGAFGIPFYIAE